MTNVLVLNSSALGAASVSKQLVAETVARLQVQDPSTQFTTRDLGASPVPHLTLDSATALRGGEPTNPAQAAARALSDKLVQEIAWSNVIVIGAPMYNFGISSTLKAWFDYVLRAGVTFRYSEAGPEGLITGKRAIVVESRGGAYSQGPTQVMDSQEPHLRTLLGFMGITDVTYVRAEKLAFGPEARNEAIAGARSKIDSIIQATSRRAA
jgi:FMN-dependent NADH-azoreductase